MKGTQNKKGLDLKLLSEKPHKDGFLDQITLNKEEIPIPKIESGKPMKMLLDEEMWLETETNQNPPSVIARLMGLNQFPQNQNSNSYEKKMELIRQKFTEAKNLATNEKLFHSKEFQDALTFLSSNRDLFVKFLEEPNSLFTNSPSISPEIKHITVLKPSEKIRKLKNIEKNEDDKSFENSRSKPLVPTRIVVLKPSLEKTLNGNNNNKSIYEESLFNKSELEMSDLDVFTPTSCRSWDFNSRIESPVFEQGFEIPVFEKEIEIPVSLSSKESRVVREAKKRLVQRWESVSSNINQGNQENQENEIEKGEIVISTLGEILTIHENDKNVERERENEERENISNGLSRSKSLPVNFRNEVEKSKDENNSNKKDYNNNKSGLFKWKLSSLFFSKNNSKEKEVVNEERESSLVGTDPCTSSSCDLQENVDISIKDEEPSPVSVLEASSLSYSDNFSLSSQNPASITSKIISRSPPIGSISRSLSWDNSQFDEIMSPNSLRLSRLFSKADEEQDSFTFIQKLVKFSNLEREDKKTWFSSEIPLDPSLFYEFLGYKFDQKREKERLWFDSVNESILEIDNCVELRFYPWFRVSNLEMKIEFEADLSDQIWSVMRNWCTTFERLSPNYEVDLVAKKEVSGTKLENAKLFEMFGLSMEICGFIIEELIQEFILEF